MKYTKLLLLFLYTILPVRIYSFEALDTISIKGDITFDEETVVGDFLYTLKNNDTDSQTEWQFIIHPSVNILSVSHENEQASIEIQHGINFRLLTVKLPRKISANTRSTISIRFSIHTQEQDPRITVSSNFVFLDARRFWFPYPNKDNQINYQFIIKTPSHLNSIMGGKLQSEAIIIDEKISSWENELPDLSLSASLIITDQIKSKRKFATIYTDNKEKAYHITEEITPYWDIMVSHKFFPLSEIHILPINIHIPNYALDTVDGEFLGNIFLIDQELFDQLASDSKEYDKKISERITETLVHELYHSYFPGLAKHKPEDKLFIESFVQYLTWDLMATHSKELERNFGERSRFFLQNFHLKKNYNYLWDFLFDSSLLHGTLSASGIKGKDLADTAVEKYRYIPFSKQDILETISQLQSSALPQKDPLNINILQSKNTNLYNSAIEIEQTNFNIFITNKRKFRKKQVVALPVQTTFLSIKHDFPFPWTGTLFWETTQHSNKLDITIPPSTTWETNLIGKINLIKTKSHLDVLESDLRDNVLYAKKNIGQKIIERLNKPLAADPFLTIPKKEQDKIDKWKQEGLFIAWDYINPIENNTFDIGAFLYYKDKRKNSFIIISLLKIDDNHYELIRIQDNIQ